MSRRSATQRKLSEIETLFAQGREAAESFDRAADLFEEGALPEGLFAYQTGAVNLSRCEQGRARLDTSQHERRVVAELDLLLEEARIAREDADQVRPRAEETG